MIELNKHTNSFSICRLREVWGKWDKQLNKQDEQILMDLINLNIFFISQYYVRGKQFSKSMFICYHYANMT